MSIPPEQVWSMDGRDMATVVELLEENAKRR